MMLEAARKSGSQPTEALWSPGQHTEALLHPRPCLVLCGIRNMSFQNVVSVVHFCSRTKTCPPVQQCASECQPVCRCLHAVRSVSVIWGDFWIAVIVSSNPKDISNISQGGQTNKQLKSLQNPVFQCWGSAVNTMPVDTVSVYEGSACPDDKNYHSWSAYCIWQACIKFLWAKQSYHPVLYSSKLSSKWLISMRSHG